jgi:hypothetical protein
MAVQDLFSKRRKAAAKAGKPDVYVYDLLPEALRVQVVHIWLDLIGRISDRFSPATSRWQYLHDAMAREKGVFELNKYGNVSEKWVNFFLTCEVEDALDMIEFSFDFMERLCGGLEDWELQQRMAIFTRPDEAVAELNTRFREHGVGYKYAGGQLVRIDSQYVHSEAVMPALALLTAAPFANANKEFMTAHRHYREGHYKDCVVAANRAFETTLKTICHERKWPFKSGDRASELVTIVRNQRLFSDYLDKGFDAYVAMLKTGLPGVRNNAGGHGEEPRALPVPDYIAAYALHLTATNIVLVVEAFNRQA